MMEPIELGILLRLLVAHFLADYTFQPDKWVRSKTRNQLKSSSFYLHILVVGVLTYLLLADWSNWQAPLIIAITHLIIDGIKISINKNTITAFIIDQALHILIIFGVWIYLSDQSQDILLWIEGLLRKEEFWLIALGLLINTMPLAILIGFMTRKWTDELNDDQEDGEDHKISIKENNIGLKNAGRWIGILERILIFIFIISNEARAIGFLLAAKSIFRFGDLKDNKDRKRTEYILIGTLTSFTTSIIVSMFIKYLLG